MADLLVGLDVGTTATKALLFDLRGHLRASASRAYGLATPHPGWVEQDAEALWGAVVETLRALSSECGPGDRVVALAQSSQGGTTIPVDGAGRPLHAAFSWMDQRAVEEARAAEARWGKAWIHRQTGWDLIAGLPLQHIAWFRRHCPAEFAATARVHFVNDFVGYRLTGQLAMNPSDAGITQLMDLAAGDWDESLLDAAGITRAHLSPLKPSGAPIGKLTREAAILTGLSADTLVANGAHDQYCAAVGAGVTRPGRLLLSCGTAWVILAVPEDLASALATGMAVSRHAVADRWGAITSLGGVGSSLEWLIDNVWGGAGTGAGRDALYAALNAGAACVAPGSDGALFLPMAGGHGATYGPGRGGFVHLSIAHSRGHLARSVMEGTAFELRRAVADLRAAGVEVAELTMVGGAARSPVWPQIVADVLAARVTVPTLRDAAARGAAILAGVGAGLFADPEAGFAAWPVASQRVAPVPENCRRYEGAYAAYQEALERWSRGT